MKSGDFTTILQLKMSKKLGFIDFVYATRSLTPNFIKLKKCTQNVYDSPSTLKYCMMVCGKLISYQYNSKNLDTTVDLRIFQKYEQISMTQRSQVHNLGFMLYKISLTIPASGILLFEAQCVITMIIRQ